MLVSRSTMKMLGALTITSFAAKVIARAIKSEHPRATRLPRLCDKIFDRSVEIRKMHWQTMAAQGVRETELRVKHLEEHILPDEINGHVLMRLSRIMLTRLQEELWNCGSRKGGIIDELVRDVEDLQAMIAGEEQEYIDLAQSIYEKWIQSLDLPVKVHGGTGKKKLKIRAGRRAA